MEPEQEMVAQAGVEGPSPVEALQQEVASLREGLGLAAAKYRALLLSQAPEIPEELVGGETVAEVEASFAKAREVVEKVRQRLEARLSQERVPAGVPPRGEPDLGGLSPKEKIAFALGQRR